MKFYFLFGFILCFVFNTLGQNWLADLLYDTDHCNGELILSSEEGVCDYHNYILVFEDDFDSSAINFSKWKLPFQGVIRGYKFDSEKQWYANTNSLPSIPYEHNFEFENGIMKIIAQKEDPPISGTYYDYEHNPGNNSTSTFDYSSGQLESKYRFPFGIFEIRCKIPKGKGFWPAFWLFGGQKYNELDIFEFWNDYSGFSEYYDPVKSCSNHHMNIQYEIFNDSGKHNTCPAHYFGVDYSLDFHIFAVKWTPYLIEFYVDNELKRREYRYSNLNGQYLGCNNIEYLGQYMLNTSFPIEPMNIITNLALQATSIDLPDESTPFPGSLEVDYIRYYKQLGCSVDLSFNSNSELNLSSDVYNVIVGNNLTLGSDIHIGADQQLTLIGSNEIIIDQNTIIENGANFTTEIRPDLCSGYHLMLNNDTEKYDESKTDFNTVLNTEELPDIKSSKNIQIKPNPFDNKITIEAPNTNQFYWIKINNLLGNRVFESTIKSTSEFDLSFLQAGVYLISLYDSDHNILKNDKLVKK